MKKKNRKIVLAIILGMFILNIATITVNAYPEQPIDPPDDPPDYYVSITSRPENVILYVDMGQISTTLSWTATTNNNPDMIYLYIDDIMIAYWTSWSNNVPVSFTLETDYKDSYKTVRILFTSDSGDSDEDIVTVGFEFDPSDYDSDLINNEHEALFGYSEYDPDYDDDGVYDGNEDFDGDGLSNYEELYFTYTNPIFPNYEVIITSRPENVILYVDMGQIGTTLSWTATTNSNPSEYYIYVDDFEEDDGLWANDEIIQFYLETDYQDLRKTVKIEFHVTSGESNDDSVYVDFEFDDSDYDSDLIINEHEALFGYSEYDPDFDDNGVYDGNEDFDGDGLSNYEELYIYTTDPLDQDPDEDGLSDYEEVFYGTDGYITDPDEWDSDGDGLGDGEEIFIYGTDPTSIDSDNDLMPDMWEIDNSLDPCSDDGIGDPDNDNLENIGEYNFDTDPNDPDTDKDRLNDGEEVNSYGTNPTKFDTDDDFMSDYEELIVEKSDALIAEIWDGGPMDVDITFLPTVPVDFCSQYKDPVGYGNFLLPRSLYAYIINRTVDSRNNNKDFYITNIERNTPVRIAIIDGCDWINGINHGWKCEIEAEVKRDELLPFTVLGLPPVVLFDYDDYGSLSYAIEEVAKLGYDVISVSDKSAVAMFIINETVERYGVTIVGGTGNTNDENYFEGVSRNENVIAVGGYDWATNKRWYFPLGDIWEPGVLMGSNYGIHGFNGVDIVAEVRDHYCISLRLSWAVPKVAAIVGVMLEKNCILTTKEIREILRETAIQINFGLGSKKYDYNDAQPKDWPAGWDKEVGYGLVYGTEARDAASIYWD